MRVHVIMYSISKFSYQFISRLVLVRIGRVRTRGSVVRKFASSHSSCNATRPPIAGAWRNKCTRVMHEVKRTRTRTRTYSYSYTTVLRVHSWERALGDRRAAGSASVSLHYIRGPHSVECATPVELHSRTRTSTRVEIRVYKFMNIYIHI